MFFFLHSRNSPQFLHTLYILLSRFGHSLFQRLKNTARIIAMAANLQNIQAVCKSACEGMPTSSTSTPRCELGDPTPDVANSPGTTLVTMPAEIQYMIYTQVLLNILDDKPNPTCPLKKLPFVPRTLSAVIYKESSEMQPSYPGASKDRKIKNIASEYARRPARSRVDIARSVAEDESSEGSSAEGESLEGESAGIVQGSEGVVVEEKTAKTTTAVLTVCKEVHAHALKAFLDTWPRTIQLFDSTARDAIDRKVNNHSAPVFASQNKADEGDEADGDLQSLLQHRHINVHAQIDFEEDLATLSHFKSLLTNRDHVLTYNIHLGFLDTHWGTDTLGYLFSLDQAGINATMDTIAGLRCNGKKKEKVKIEIKYRQFCNCAIMRENVKFGDAMRVVDKACEMLGMECLVECGMPWGLARFMFGQRPRSILRRGLNGV
ncbi:hypothetical protein EJ08DRAFT_523033 [Tothia fuscella]|uniref:Uncharacterized protein n=1 Tax=Tothia fuscella TaxID=1048955 RepID=A0A9P4NH70_9PEZI|nr:hypothetical protein EJ08DRAFT_523033 [Tothia fuscella]